MKMNFKRLDFKKARHRLWVMIGFCAIVIAFKISPIAKFVGLDNGPRSAHAARSNNGDLDRDGDIDLDDLQIFSIKWLGLDLSEVDWCQWYLADSKIHKHLGGLGDFIMEHFQCDSTEPPEPPTEDPLAVENINTYPMRLALGPANNIYVSDPKVGSVFIYDPNFVVIGELKGLNKPLGVAVDAQGNIFVGSSGQKNVEVYNAKGEKTAVIGRGLIKMPNDLTLDRNDRLYVVDSKSKVVWVFSSNGAILRSIGTPGDGDSQFRFPEALTIAYYTDPSGQETGELYVADQERIKVFDLDGNFLRSFGGMVIKHGGMMGDPWWEWEGLFVKTQSLAFDNNGQLHVLDCYMDSVQILDPDTGDYLSHYGEKGTGPGQLNLPMDIVINDLNQTIVSEARNKRVELIYTTP